MAFRQQHRPQSLRHISYHEPPAEIGTASSPRQKRTLEESEEWVLFSPGAPSTTARTHTTSTERTPRTAGLSRLSDFGSLDTAARSQDDELYQGTEEGEELDSLDDGLHAFHEPSEYAGPSNRLQQSGDTVLPTHDGLGTFQPDADVAEHMWQFERPMPRRRQARRRSSVQRRLDALEETEELTQEQDRRQRIEQWRLEQSRALLEEIERETRRRRRMSMVSAARSRTDSAHRGAPGTTARPASDAQSDSSDESTENLSFWQRLTRRVIRDLMGIDEDTLSVIFGESIPDDTTHPPASLPPSSRPSIDATLAAMHAEGLPDAPWQHRLLDRVARELGLLVTQLSEHPGAFSTYRAQDVVSPASLAPPPRRQSTSLSEVETPLVNSVPSSAQFAPTFPGEPVDTSLWGIEEENEPGVADPLDAFREKGREERILTEELATERAYWERELDVKMVFTFLLQRFSSRRSSFSQQGSDQNTSDTPVKPLPTESARRAALIRANHPLVSSSNAQRTRRREAASALPTSSKSYKAYYAPPVGNSQGVAGTRSASSVTSQSLSKRGKGGERNYWDFGGSVGSGSVIEGKA